jgi:predicted ATPase
VSALRFTRLKLDNWRNFRSVDISLKRRAIFIGPNASGKSNLLDVFRFLHDLVGTGGGLRASVERRGGIKSIRALAAREKPNISIEVHIGDDQNPEQWTYKLEFKGVSNKDGSPQVQMEEVWQNGKSVAKITADNLQADTARLSQTMLEQSSANTKFREIYTFFESIRYLHVVPHIVRDPTRQSGKNDPYGGDLLSRINATSVKTRDARLKRMTQALQIAVPQLSELEMIIDKSGAPHLRAKYQHWRPQGGWQQEDKFSDGTLRLLGIIWSLQEKGGPLLLEEPELSLNPEITRYIPALISRAMRNSRRQAFITTHSANLLADKGIAPEELHLLTVEKEGSIVRSANDMTELSMLANTGLSVGELVLSKARPTNPEKLPLFDLVA